MAIYHFVIQAESQSSNLAKYTFTFRVAERFDAFSVTCFQFLLIYAVVTKYTSYIKSHVVTESEVSQNCWRRQGPSQTGPFNTTADVTFQFVLD